MTPGANTSVDPAGLAVRLRALETEVTSVGTRYLSSLGAGAEVSNGARAEYAVDNELPTAVLERLVALSLELFNCVRSYERERGDRVRAGDEPHGVEAARPITELYRRWYMPSRWLLALLDALPAGRSDVARREELLEACRKASFPAHVDLDAVQRGLEQVKRGEIVPLTEAMNELRRRRLG